jgi:hypothetical protein
MMVMPTMVMIVVWLPNRHNNLSIRRCADSNQRK